jgi:hypothetical protein
MPWLFSHAKSPHSVSAAGFEPATAEVPVAFATGEVQSHCKTNFSPGKFGHGAVSRVYELSRCREQESNLPPSTPSHFSAQRWWTLYLKYP